MRPEQALAERARAPHTPIRDGDCDPDRSGEGHSRAGHGHQPPDHGLDHGHHLDALGAFGDGIRHRQTGRCRRVRRARGRSGPRRHLPDTRSPQVPPRRGRDTDPRRPGLRPGREVDRTAAVRGRLQRRGRQRLQGRGVQPKGLGPRGTRGAPSGARRRERLQEGGHDHQRRAAGAAGDGTRAGRGSGSDHRRQRGSNSRTPDHRGRQRRSRARG